MNMFRPEIVPRKKFIELEIISKERLQIRIKRIKSGKEVNCFSELFDTLKDLQSRESLRF